MVICSLQPFVDRFQSLNFAEIVGLRREYRRPPFCDGKRFFPRKLRQHHAMVREIVMEVVKQFDG